MSFILRLAVLEPSPEIAISEAQVIEARRARDVLTSAFALEEAYDLLLSNYLELEQEALCLAATSVVRSRRSYEEAFEVRANTNRRVVNLLTAARLYLDHAPQRLARCASDARQAQALFKNVTSTQYDSQFSYRFMEALRNHVQHAGLAVHTVRHASQWTGTEPSKALETRLELLSERKFLQENDQFHKKTFLELPAQVELIQASREYLQGLGQVHAQVRALIEETAPAARESIQALIDSYAKVCNGHILSLSIIRVHGDEQETLMPIFLKWDDVRLKLVERNSNLGNLSRRFATGGRQS